MHLVSSWLGAPQLSARSSCRAGAHGSRWEQRHGVDQPGNVMADEGNVKTPLDALQDTLSRLKEMAHYSKTNIEKLATLWLEVSEHKEQKQYEKMVDEVLKRQNQFQESITALIEAYEEATTRLRADAHQQSGRAE